MDGARRRPLGIWMIVILEIINASLVLADFVLGDTITDPRFAGVSDAWSVRATVIFWASLVILASVLLWRLDRRGWALMMVLVGLSLAANLAVWWATPAETNWGSMTVSIATAFYLNSAAVRTLFLHKHEVSRITLSDRRTK